MTLALDLDIDITNKQSEPETSALADWRFGMEPHEEDATDQILDYLIKTGARPHVAINGDIVAVSTAIVSALNAAVPQQLAEPLKVMNDYIVRWLATYFLKANIRKIDVTFGFGAKPLTTMSTTQEGDTHAT